MKNVPEVMTKSMFRVISLEARKKNSAVSRIRRQTDKILQQNMVCDNYPLFAFPINTTSNHYLIKEQSFQHSMCRRNN